MRLSPELTEHLRTVHKYIEMNPGVKSFKVIESMANTNGWKQTHVLMLISILSYEDYVHVQPVDSLLGGLKLWAKNPL